MTKDQLAERYGASASNNFRVIDTIGVPHPYCITPRHIAHAERFGGSLSKECIESAEKSGAKCGVAGCRLAIGEHEQALLVGCEPEKELSALNQQEKEELQSYLLKCRPMCIEDGFVGFAFVQEQ